MTEGTREILASIAVLILGAAVLVGALFLAATYQ